MNVKGLAGQNTIMNGVTPTQVTKSLDKSIKSDTAHDRDANGQAGYQKQKKRSVRKLEPHEAQKALKLLNEKKFMLEMKWQGFLIEENKYFYVEIKDEQNLLIRRMNEESLFEVLEEQLSAQDTSSEKSKGNLLKKTA